ncbi:hypothetical protein M011DRAFT_473829 [Sporormia fimetaria CBS 119925]|uniref:DUF7732 domain-containing protein n=1 Tax=Sporormia fimetaria CBS 119925 TaxID=1340428 RepID=A0A6A6VND0_9PLEO|nr:hypothetical protein M011DRAFT_473829 [Sporormia fimetaria CBS 119925]
MKLLQLLTYVAVTTSAANAASIPEVNALEAPAAFANTPRSDILAPENALEKRKGGGAGGGGGGGGRGGGGGGRTGGGGGGGQPRANPNSVAGGATRLGSGPPRTFSGGKYYGGGVAVPYTAGSRSPRGLVPGALLLPAAALLIFPGLWLYSVYPYYYNNPHRFYNETARMNESLPVQCLCQENSVCGCDENEDEQYWNDLIGSGNYAALNKSQVTVSDVNGTKTIVINGTLPKGTTAPGGEDDPVGAANVLRLSGYWAMVMIVLSTVAFL